MLARGRLASVLRDEVAEIIGVQLGDAAPLARAHVRPAELRAREQPLAVAHLGSVVRGDLRGHQSAHDAAISR
jgi:hypothetical protein